MSMIEAKGVHDMTFSFTAYPGDSAVDIKETLNPQGDSECQKRLNELHVQLKLLEEDHKPDRPDSSDGFSKTLTTSKDNHNTEITNNDGNHINISDGNPDNHVNNTADQNENPSVIPIKSSEPSEPSGDKDILTIDNRNGNDFDDNGNGKATAITTSTLANTIYWREHGGDWGCKCCRLNGDRFLMQKHNCSGKR